MFEATAAITRIGLLVPSSNAVMEVEFYRSPPTDITVHTSRIYRASAAVDAQAMAETGRNAAQTALSLSQTQLALIVYGHTAWSDARPPEAFLAQIKAEIVSKGQLIRESGAKPD